MNLTLSPEPISWSLTIQQLNNQLLVRNLHTHKKYLSNGLFLSCFFQSIPQLLQASGQHRTGGAPAVVRGAVDIVMAKPWGQRMHDTLATADEEEWVIWNSTHGLVTTVTIDRVEIGAGGRMAWLDEPFDMVGPFSLDELETHGRISYAACIVMSRQRWQDDQVELRRESLEIRRAEQERMNEEFARFSGDHSGYRGNRKPFDEQQHRQTLNLPIDGKLEPRKINAAFRRLAQKAHPDVGGSNEQFVRITEARNALLEYIS